MSLARYLAAYVPASEGGAATIDASTGAATASGLAASVTQAESITASVAAALASGLAASVATPPFVSITDFYARGADLVIEYDHGSPGTGDLLTASLERDGTPIADVTTSSL